MYYQRNIFSAAREDNFVLGSEYKKSKCDQEHPNAPTESVYTQRMREKLEREKELAARAVVINRGLDQALSDCDEPDVSKQHMPSGKNLNDKQGGFFVNLEINACGFARIIIRP